MHETEQHEITLSKIFQALLRKFYIILIAVFVAAIAGGAFGYIQNRGKDVYGATTKFKISVVSQLAGSQETQAVNHTYSETLLAMITDEMAQASFVESKILPELAKSYQIPQYDPNNLENGFFNVLSLVQSSIRYSFDHKSNSNAISVSVRSTDKAFARALLDCVKVVVPEYIEENMIRPQDKTVDYDGTTKVVMTYHTRCQELTLSYVKTLNAGQATTEMIKTAVIFAFGAAVIAAVVIIILDNADARVRDSEKLEQVLDVPVLAAIPKMQDVKTTHSPIMNKDGEKEE
jgi:capsular polysaccharide biosynthesis protein